MRLSLPARATVLIRWSPYGKHGQLDWPAVHDLTIFTAEYRPKVLASWRTVMPPHDRAR